ncbi:NADH-dependent flavin oxidoreductase [Ligilactobacillus pobuzihii]|uniref:NADH-dependent flavin oxidoreductase n=1 Tax=Ligilactobacillus pobuzihii TaxID=449659 RepID=UPI0019D1534F|nr:NADH-dependent flavin oxidoreductase [Ligilactobacillus pobuzihii]MBN7275276.1 NADH-dependent flavin oxidoreductase [Ligilactobacillus pobuzihii]
MTKYSFLQPYTFENKNITLKNRVVIPPMTERMSFEDGTITSDETAYYAQHTGGAGMFITAVANVNSLGKGFEGELSIADDRFLPGLSDLASSIKKNGTKAIIQIFSAGRMSSTAILRGKQPVSASAIPAIRADSETPRELSEEEVEQTIKDFGAATKRAIEAGFDGIELHGANTYLLQQFFSPHSNRRTDKWGGSLEKRMKFPLAVIKEATKVIEKYATKPFLLGYRISPEELEEPGITLDDTLQFIEQLKQTKIDYLHVSQSDVWRTPLRDEDSRQIVNGALKKRISNAFPMIVVGNLKTPADAEKASESFDLVALGHESLWEPKWVQKITNNEESAIRYSIAKSDLADLGIKPSFMDQIADTMGGYANMFKKEK